MIEPTLNIDEAARRTWDVVVVGAGPAGAMAALLLARDGVEVLLVDRRNFPRGKVCGGCLNGRALTMLQRAGLAEALEELGGCDLHAFHLAAGNRHARLALPAGLAVSRSALDAMLVSQAARAGASFLPSTVGRIGAAGSGRRTVQADCRGNRKTISSRVVVSATGLAMDQVPEPELSWHVEPHSRLGVGTTATCYPKYYTPGTIYMAVGAGGYVGLTCVEAGRLNIAAAIDRSCIAAAGVATACEDILRSVGFPLSDAMLQGDWLGTAGLTRSRRHCAGQRLFAVGDSAGYVEPFTGEGMSWAIESGARVVPLVREGIRHWSADLASQWDRQWRQGLAKRQRLCRALSRLLRRPLVVRGVVGTLRMFPAIGRPVIRSFNSE